MPLNNPLRYACPTCEEPAGERCRELDSGDLMHNFHHARQLAAIPRRIDRIRQTLDSKRTMQQEFDSRRGS